MSVTFELDTTESRVDLASVYGFNRPSLDTHRYCLHSVNENVAFKCTQKAPFLQTVKPNPGPFGGDHERSKSGSSDERRFACLCVLTEIGRE